MGTKGYDYTPTEDGGYQVRKVKTHGALWVFYGFLLLAAMLQPDVAVRIVGFVFVALTIIALIARAAAKPKADSTK